MTEDKARLLLSAHPLVDFVEENGFVYPSYNVQTFSDDTFWNLDRVDNRGPIYSYKAYGYTSTASNVRAYVVDAGIRASHYEFDLDGNEATVGSRVVAGGNFVAQWGDHFPPNNPCGGNTNDLNVGHGTAVASILGGRETGVAKNVTLVPVKAATCSPYQFPVLAICWGLDWIIQDMGLAENASKRAVVVMSFGTDGAGGADCPDGMGGLVNCVSAMENNINNVIGAGHTVVVSANNGNDGNCTTSPARMGYGGTHNTTHRTITVGGTMYRRSGDNYTDVRWDCDAEGCASEAGQEGSNYGPCVSIYAPAWSIRSAHTNGFLSYRPNTPLGTQGTSWAAPLVAGLAAKLLRSNPYLTPQQVWTRLQSDANRLGIDLDPGPTFNNLLVYQSVYD